MMDLKAWPLSKRIKLAWKLIWGYTTEIEEVVLQGNDISRFLKSADEIRELRKHPEVSQQSTVSDTLTIPEPAVFPIDKKVSFLNTRVGALEKRAEELERQMKLANEQIGRKPPGVI